MPAGSGVLSEDRAAQAYHGLMASLSPTDQLVVDGPVVFYDGECGLCHRGVRWVARRDRKQMIRFAPLQGSTAAETVGTPNGPLESWTMLLLDETGRFDRSDAVLRIWWHLGGFWRVISWLRIVPRWLRDPLYRFVARNRIRWFGRAEMCDLPDEGLLAQVLP